MKVADPTEVTPLRDDIFSLSSYALYGPNNIAPNLPPVQNQTVKKMTITPLVDGRLLVKAESSGVVNFVNDGTTGKADITRDQEFYLKQVDGHWKIEGWNGRLNIKPR